MRAKITESSLLYPGWLIAIGASLSIAVSFGMRSAFGTTFESFQITYGWSVSEISLAASINLLFYGLLQPAVGAFVDRYGSGRILSVSVLFVAAGTFWMGQVSTLWELYVAYGLLVGFGIALASPVSVSAAVAPYFDKRRGFATGIANAGSPIGQLLFVPSAMALILYFGFSEGYFFLSGALFVFFILTTFIFVTVQKSEDKLVKAKARQNQTPLRQALKCPEYWILAFIMIVCGYTSAGVMITHMIPYASFIGLAPMAGASALSIVGIANLIGVLGTGYLGDRIGRVKILAILFFVRAVSYLLFLTIASNIVSFLFIAFIYGSTHSATMTTTAALIGDRFGRRSVGLLYGWLLLVHQVAAAIGAYLTGVNFDINHSYLFSFGSAIMLTLSAAIAARFLKNFY